MLANISYEHRTSVWILHQCQNVFQRTYWYNIGRTTCATTTRVAYLSVCPSACLSVMLYNSFESLDLQSSFFAVIFSNALHCLSKLGSAFHSNKVITKPTTFTCTKRNKIFYNFGTFLSLLSRRSK